MSNSKNFRGLGKGLETLLNPKNNPAVPTSGIPSNQNSKTPQVTLQTPISINQNVPLNPLPNTSDKPLDGASNNLANLANDVANIDGLVRIPVFQLRSGRFQPRQNFDEEALNSLAESIKSQGLVQPIIVKELTSNEYEIIAGERRWRAAQRAGLKNIPVLVRNDIDNKEAMAIALVENIQREDLNAIEEAEALQRLHQEFSLTHKEIAKIIGRSRTAVSNTLRLLELKKDVQEMVRDGQLKMGHVRALLSLDSKLQTEFAQRTIDKELSVRNVETMVQQHLEGKGTNKDTKEKIPTQTLESINKIQETLESQLKHPVNIRHQATGKGTINISFNSLEDLENISKLLKLDS